MNPIVRTMAIAALLAMCVGGTNGCAAMREKGQAVSDAVAGKAYNVINAPPKDVSEAAMEACQELRLVIVSSTPHDAASISIVARSRDDERLTVTVTPEGDHASRLTVDTGFFGDTTLRDRLFRKIRNLADAGPDDAQSADAR